MTTKKIKITYVAHYIFCWSALIWATHDNPTSLDNMTTAKERERENNSALKGTDLGKTGRHGLFFICTILHLNEFLRLT